jgi:hypothetical protein
VQHAGAERLAVSQRQPGLAAFGSEQALAVSEHDGKQQ